MHGDPALSAWESFYVIVGSSGAALIGLQFVVIAVIADRRPLATGGSISAFGTPTVVHFGGALIISAIMSAPWPSLVPASVVLALGGLGGLVYGVIVVRHARRQTEYEPMGEDWLWYSILPCTAYAALGVAALWLRARSQLALFVVAGAALSLLLIGIHNAWDTVTYIVLGERSREAPKPDHPPR